MSHHEPEPSSDEVASHESAAHERRVDGGERRTDGAEQQDFVLTRLWLFVGLLALAVGIGAGLVMSAVSLR